MNDKQAKPKQERKIAHVRSAKSVLCKVHMLDGTVEDKAVDKKAYGNVLFDMVCSGLNLLEKDYFGLSYVDSTGLKFWLNTEKKIAKQMKNLNQWEFLFEVKFYAPDPSLLHEDLTRYQICLQLRRDITSGRLPCSFLTYALLGSYTAQSELGDYDMDEFGPGISYLSDIEFSPNQDKEQLYKIAELHKQLRGQSPEEAEVKFLENAKKLAMYGVELHNAQDAEGINITLGVSASGLIVYKDNQQVNRFVWPKILKISYRRNKFYLKLRPGEFERFESLIGFRLMTIKLAKRLWKICVEHHTFFRFREPEPMKGVGIIPRLGSRFRYSGRTQFQTRQVATSADRESPYFDRVHSKRATYHGKSPNKNLADEMYRSQPERRPSPIQAPPPLPTIGPAVEEHFVERKRREPEEYESEGDREEPIDRKSRMEQIHAVPTALAVVTDHETMEREHEKDNNNINVGGPPAYTVEDIEMDFQRPIVEKLSPKHAAKAESRPSPVQEKPLPPSPKDRKLTLKEEKEKKKREQAEEKRRKKEEEIERKKMEKEKKAMVEQEKRAAREKGKQKGRGKEKEEDKKQKKKGKEDIGQGWQEAVAVAVVEGGREVEIQMTGEEREIGTRLSSFEEKKDLDTSDHQEPEADHVEEPEPQKQEEEETPVSDEQEEVTTTLEEAEVKKPPESKEALEETFE